VNSGADRPPRGECPGWMDCQAHTRRTFVTLNMALIGIKIILRYASTPEPSAFLKFCGPQEIADAMEFDAGANKWTTTRTSKRVPSCLQFCTRSYHSAIPQHKCGNERSNVLRAVCTHTQHRQILQAHVHQPRGERQRDSWPCTPRKHLVSAKICAWQTRRATRKQTNNEQKILIDSCLKTCISLHLQSLTRQQKHEFTPKTHMRALLLTFTCIYIQPCE
jgi:hypothetical protein